MVPVLELNWHVSPSDGISVFLGLFLKWVVNHPMIERRVWFRRMIPQSNWCVMLLEDVLMPLQPTGCFINVLNPLLKRFKPAWCSILKNMDQILLSPVVKVNHNTVHRNVGQWPIEHSHVYNRNYLILFTLGKEEDEQGTRWHSTRRMIFVPRSAQKSGFAGGFWPIPEAFWPDSTLPSLPPRSSHPNVKFLCQSIEPLAIENFPFDKYELEPNPLTQYILARKQPNTCWQVIHPVHEF